LDLDLRLWAISAAAIVELGAGSFGLGSFVIRVISLGCSDFH